MDDIAALEHSQNQEDNNNDVIESRKVSPRLLAKGEEEEGGENE